jgi:hypothetical protein
MKMNFYKHTAQHKKQLPDGFTALQINSQFIIN